MKSFLILVLILVLAVITVRLGIDITARRAVERYGTQILGVEVTLDSATISILKGKGELKALNIPNPANFRPSDAITIPTIRFTFSRFSALRQTLHIEEMEIDQAYILYDTSPEGSNIASLQRHAADWYSREDKKRLIAVDTVSIKQGRVMLAAYAETSKSGVILPDSELRRLGKSQEGITPSQLTAKILQSMHLQVARAGINLGAIAVETLRNTLKSMLP